MSMKILFATPPLSMEDRYGSLAGAGSTSPTLGLMQLAAVTRQQGYLTDLLDATAQGLSKADFLGRLTASEPDILALSATTLGITHAAHIATEAKILFPALRVVVGGPHPSAVPVDTMERFPIFDCTVVGEGEETLLAVLTAWSETVSLESVVGIVYRDADGMVQQTQRRPFISDLDALPYPAWDSLEGFPHQFSPPAFKTRQLPAASLVTSRGCPNRCIFCDRSVFGSSCHAFSAEYIVGMIVDLHERYGVREFCFEDDTFITFRGRLEEICNRLIELRLGITWSCLGRVNQITEKGLELMRRAGCWQISFGIESGSQRILELIHKKVTLDQIRRGLAMSRAAGMLNKGFFIVGHPGETRQTLRETIDFALELPLDDISVNMLTPFPGTELYERAAEFGQFDPDWSRMNMLNAVFIPHGLSEEDLVVAQKELLRRFYLRPQVVANYCGRLVRNPSLAVGLWGGFRALMRSI